MYSFEELEVWKISRKLRKEISNLVKTFPPIEKYRLTDQIIRSSRSVTSNIAVGFGRFHFKENIQYCRQSRGSLLETLEHLYVALYEKYINEDIFLDFRKKIFFNLKILNGYINYLIKKNN